MISRPEARKLVKRFEGLPGFPKTEEGVELLIDMMETATSAGAARVFATTWLQDEIIAPTPAHVYRYFHPRKLAGSSTPVAKGKCPHCNGVGWVIVEGANQTTAAKRCQCATDAIQASLGL
jgi:excinuclease UvrABC ATPase subunit